MSRNLHHVSLYNVADIWIFAQVCMFECILSSVKFPRLMAWLCGFSFAAVFIFFNFQMYAWSFNTLSEQCFPGDVASRSSDTSTNFINKSSILSHISTLGLTSDCCLLTLCIWTGSVCGELSLSHVSAHHLTPNNYDSTNHLLPKPLNNMWDYHLFFNTTIHALNHCRWINLKTALVSVINMIITLDCVLKGLRKLVFRDGMTVWWSWHVCWSDVSVQACHELDEASVQHGELGGWHGYADGVCWSDVSVQACLEPDESSVQHGELGGWHGYAVGVCYLMFLVQACLEPDEPSVGRLAWPCWWCELIWCFTSDWQWV